MLSSLASLNLVSVMHLHHWLAWLAVNLAILLLGVGMSQPPPDLVAMAAFDDAYLVPTAPRGSVTEPRKFRRELAGWKSAQPKTTCCVSSRKR